MTVPFENKTDAAIRHLAGRSLQADQRRNLFLLLTITLTTALLSGSLFFLSAGQRRLEDEIRGQYQAVVVDATQAEIDRLSALPELERFGVSQYFGTCRYGDSTLSISYSDANWMKLGKKPDVDGTLPEKADEILVERAFLDYWGLPIETGQTLRLNLDGQEQKYTVTGILQAENLSRVFQLEVSRAYVVEHAKGEPLFEFRLRYQGSEQMDLDTLKAGIAAFLVRNDIPEDRVFYSSNYFDLEGFRATKLSRVYPIGLLILFGCGLVIYSIFYISVKGKMREYGRLKVIGATPRQLRRIVRKEGFILSLLGIPSGLLLGSLFSAFAEPAYWNLPDQLPFALLTAGSVWLMVLLSIHTPVRMAASVSPIEAVRVSSYELNLSKKNTRRSSRRITPASMAWMNFDRSRRKTILTLLSLGLTGILLFCTATVLHSIDPYRMAIALIGDESTYQISWNDSVDISEIPDTERNNPLSPALREQLLAFDEITGITAYDNISADITLPEETDAFEIHSFDREQFERLFPPEQMETGTSDYEELTAANGILITDTSEQFLSLYWNYMPKIGDTLNLTTYDGESFSVTVLGIAKENALRHCGTELALFTLPEDLAQKLYPDIDNMETVWNLHTTEDSEELREALFALLQDPLLTITSRQDLADTYRVALKQTSSIACLLLIFFFLFSLISLINTLMTGLFARQQEFGILQSTGMTGRQLSSMLSIECLYYILATLAITLTVGSAAGALLVRLFTSFQIFGTLVYRFPLLELLIFAAALFVIQLLYSAAAARYLRRLPLAERIRLTD